MFVFKQLFWFQYLFIETHFYYPGIDGTLNIQRKRAILQIFAAHSRFP